MSQKINFTVNGIKRTVEIEGHERTLDILRDELDLTGTKRGCDDRSCGACTIVINGDATKCCTHAAKKLEGAEVLTIEGLANGTDLHPIQIALVECGAVQCGYCIPGIVMELYALFTKNIDASEEELMDALALHLCRCTGYEAIYNGAKLAQERMKTG